MSDVLEHPEAENLKSRSHIQVPHLFDQATTSALSNILEASRVQDQPETDIPLVVPANYLIVSHVPEVYGTPLATIIEEVRPSCIILLGGLKVEGSKIPESAVMREQLESNVREYVVPLYTEENSATTVDNADALLKIIETQNIDVRRGITLTQIHLCLKRALRTFASVAEQRGVTIPTMYGKELPLPQGLEHGVVQDRYGSVFIPTVLRESQYMGSFEEYITPSITRDIETVQAHVDEIWAEVDANPDDPPIDVYKALPGENALGQQTFVSRFDEAQPQVQMAMCYESSDEFAVGSPLEQMDALRETGIFAVDPISLSYDDVDPRFRQMREDVSDVLCKFEFDFGNQDSDNPIIGGSNIIAAILELPIQTTGEINPLTGRGKIIHWWEQEAFITNPGSPFHENHINAELSASMCILANNEGPDGVDRVQENIFLKWNAIELRENEIALHALDQQTKDDIEQRVLRLSHRRGFLTKNYQFQYNFIVMYRAIVERAQAGKEPWTIDPQTHVLLHESIMRLPPEEVEKWYAHPTKEHASGVLWKVPKDQQNEELVRLIHNFVSEDAALYTQRVFESIRA